MRGQRPVEGYKEHFLNGALGKQQPVEGVARRGVGQGLGDGVMFVDGENADARVPKIRGYFF